MKPKIKPILPKISELKAIFRNLDKPAPSPRKEGDNRGRPRKWEANYQVSLQTRVRPETHKSLHAEAKRRKLSVGELIDEWRVNVSRWEADCVPHF